MNWKEKANELLEKIRSYTKDEDGWKVQKKVKDVTVWSKPSPEWNGTLYKAEAYMDATPEDTFKYVDPSPDGPRSKWDKAVKGLEIIEEIEKDVKVVRTITHSAVGGLISSRDFIDLVVNVNNDELISTNGYGVEHPNCPAVSDPVRGTNYPCAIICFRVPGDANKTRVASYTQTNLGGMLPKSLVENALPSNQVDMMNSLKKALREAGHWKGPMED